MPEDISNTEYIRRYKAEREATKKFMRDAGVKEDIITDWEKRTAGKGANPPTAAEKLLQSELRKRSR